MNRKHLIPLVAVVGAVVLLYVASIGPAMGIAVNRAYGHSDLDKRVVAILKFYGPLNRVSAKATWLQDVLNMWVGVWINVIPQKEQPPFSG